MTPEFLSEEFNFDDPAIVAFLDELPLWSAPFGLSLLDKINYKKNIKALDIGCGLGFPLTEIAMRLGSSSKVYGVDPWSAALEHLKKKLNVYNIQNVELINGTAENIDLPDDSIDLIVSNNGLNNVQDINKCMSECKRVAKKNCQFAATMNLENTMIEFYSVFKEIVTKNNLPHIIELIDKHIYEKRKPVNETVTLFEKNNFRTTYELDSFNYRFADGKSMFNYFMIRIAFLKSWVKLVPVESAGEIFGEIEKKLDEIAAAENGIKLTIPYIVLNAKFAG